MQILDTLKPTLAPLGLNMYGVASPVDWDAAMTPSRRAENLLPGTTAIVVVANGGPTLWRSFLADLHEDPRRLVEEEHPFDAFVQRAVLGADASLGDLPRRWFWAAAQAEVHIDFRVLAELAGIGRASRLGLLLDDVHGPWVGLRAACFVAAPGPVLPGLGLAEDAPTRLSEHCGDCHRCVAACPGGAFPNGRWAVDLCSTWHHVSPTCASNCSAREACPVGADQRYDPDEIVYHYDRARGREALRRRLGIEPEGDRFEGVGPHWGDWRARVDVKGA